MLPLAHAKSTCRTHTSCAKSLRTPRATAACAVTEETRSLLELAVREDIGPGDVTSLATIPEGLQGEGRIFAKEPGILCGVDVARCVMDLVDPSVKVKTKALDGTALAAGQDIMILSNSVRSILAAERLMLNFLQRMSGIATLTRRYVDMLRQAGSRMEVVDTRKTTPLWRALERHAVRAGGGRNHRFALYDMFLVKNNHIEAAGGVKEALRRVWAKNEDRRLRVAVEARTLAEVRDILEVGADLILLDNMPVERLREAADVIGQRAQTEITGGVTLRRLRSLAALPIDRVSIGELTHSPRALDIALHLRQKGGTRRARRA